MFAQAKIRKQQSSELSRFMHYYTRFRNHDISRKLEEPLLINIKQKMELLASSLTSKESKYIMLLNQQYHVGFNFSVFKM